MVWGPQEWLVKHIYLRNLRNLCRNEWETIVWSLVATTAQKSCKVVAVPTILKMSINILLSLSITASSAQFLRKHHIHYWCRRCLHLTLPSAGPQFLHRTYKVVPISHLPAPEIFIDVHLQSTKLWEVISDQNGLYEESSNLQLECIRLLQQNRCQQVCFLCCLGWSQTQNNGLCSLWSSWSHFWVEWNCLQIVCPNIVHTWTFVFS